MLSISVAIGIVVGLIIALVIMKVSNKDKKMITEYDERQKAVRGKAYMYAFYGVSISNVILLILCLDWKNLIQVMGMNVFFLPILVGILIQVTYCIFHDGFVGLNNNMTRYMVIMTLISVFNLVCGIMPWVKNGFIQEGEIYPGFINLVVGILFIVIGIEMAIKKCMDKKTAD